MQTLALAFQMLLGAVFATAAIAKLADRTGTRDALRGFGVPDRFTRAAAAVLPVAELATAVALVAHPTARLGAATALLLLVAFSAGIVRALAAGHTPDCHCFGQLHSRPAGRDTLARNAVLAALAAFVAAHGPGRPVDEWIAARSAAELVATGAGLAAAVLGVTALVLWRRNRGLRADLERERAASELLPPGLPVGTPAPGFSLEGLRGETLTLDSLRSRGRPVVIVFAEPGCGPCRRLLPYLGRWQTALADRLTVAVVSSGTVGENRAAAEEHGVADVLLQERSEVMDAYRVRSTPSALVVSPDGHLASGPAAGEYEIEELIRLTIQRGTAMRVGGEPLG